MVFRSKQPRGPQMPQKKTQRKVLSARLLAKALLKKSVSVPELVKICTKCGKVCQDQKALTRHMKIHNCDTYLLCQKCGKRMSVQRDMCMHSCTHSTTVGPHTCTCGRSFSSRQVLEDHVYHHSTGRSPFTCLCGEVFKQQFIIKISNKGVSPYASQIGRRWGAITMTKMSAKLPSYKSKTSTTSSPETKRIRNGNPSFQNMNKKQTFDLPTIKTKTNTMKRSKTEPTLHRRELKPLRKMPRQSVSTKLLSRRRGGGYMVTS